MSNDCDHVYVIIVVSHDARLCNILVNFIDDLMMKDSGSEAKPPCYRMMTVSTSDLKTTRHALHDYQDFTKKGP